MTAKQKTDLLVSWCSQKICDSATAEWRVCFTQHSSTYRLDLTLEFKPSIVDKIWDSETIAVSSTTKHEALNRMLRQLSKRFDVPSSFEEMAIIEAVGA